jgi:hypothetical protein
MSSADGRAGSIAKQHGQAIGRHDDASEPRRPRDARVSLRTSHLIGCLDNVDTMDLLEPDGLLVKTHRRFEAPPVLDHRF